jgi:D-3-phosphoglycerate dehydrogenase
MTDKLHILTLNSVSHAGLKLLPQERYEVSNHAERPDAILLRSHDMHGMTIPASVKAIGRAGAGTNNIPVEAMGRRGVPVFNAPGANANAVKELVLAGLLIACRNLLPAVRFVEGIRGSDEEQNRLVEENKKHYAGIELPHRTLGILGLGRVGSLVADAAIKLGMNVLGYDPEITVDAAWSLPSQVRRAHSV